MTSAARRTPAEASSGPSSEASAGVPPAADDPGIAGGLLVAEVFGPTVQGEGPSTGQAAMFLRLSRCNLSCRWCDTPYTWDWSRFDPRAEARRVPVDELARTLLAGGSGLVVVTGGEPLLQQHTGLVDLVAAVRAADRRVEIETNGTVVPDERLVELGARFNVSPKLAHSGVPAAQRLVPAALHALAGSGAAVFKFVARADPLGLGDLHEIDALVGQFGLDPVWVMPEGTSAETVAAGLRRLAEPVIARGWNVSGRLHLLIWGDERGH